MPTSAKASSKSSSNTRPDWHDMQREAVYQAEYRLRNMSTNADKAEASHGPAARTVEIAGSTLVFPVERKFGDLASIQRYVDAVLALSWVAAMNPRPTQEVRVVERRGNAHAHYQRYGKDGAAELAFSSKARREDSTERWAMREIVVLHELAHHLSADEACGHGPLFCARLLDLVEGIMGAEAAFVLRMAFYEGRVDVAADAASSAASAS